MQTGLRRFAKDGKEKKSNKRKKRGVLRFMKAGRVIRRAYKMKKIKKTQKHDQKHERIDLKTCDKSNLDILIQSLRKLSIKKEARNCEESLVYGSSSLRLCTETDPCAIVEVKADQSNVEEDLNETFEFEPKNDVNEKALSENEKCIKRVPKNPDEIVKDKDTYRQAYLLLITSAHPSPHQSFNETTKFGNIINKLDFLNSRSDRFEEMAFNTVFIVINNEY